MIHLCIMLSNQIKSNYWFALHMLDASTSYKLSLLLLLLLLLSSLLLSLEAFLMHAKLKRDADWKLGLKANEK